MKIQMVDLFKEIVITFLIFAYFLLINIQNIAFIFINILLNMCCAKEYTNDYFFTLSFGRSVAPMPRHFHQLSFQCLILRV